MGGWLRKGGIHLLGKVQGWSCLGRATRPLKALPDLFPVILPLVFYVRYDSVGFMTHFCAFTAFLRR